MGVCPKSRPNIALEPTPTAFARPSLRLSARLTAGVRSCAAGVGGLAGVQGCRHPLGAGDCCVMRHTGGAFGLDLPRPWGCASLAPGARQASWALRMPVAAPRRPTGPVVSGCPPVPVEPCTRGDARSVGGQRAVRGRWFPSTGGTGGKDRSGHGGPGRVAQARGAESVGRAQVGAAWRWVPALTAHRPCPMVSRTGSASSRVQTSGTDHTASRVA